MSIEDELASMEAAIGNVVSTTLSNIRKKLSGSNDFVLVDPNNNFKTLFLETAKKKTTYAYNAYLMEAKYKKLINTSNNTTNESEKTLVSRSSKQTSFPETKGPTAVHSPFANRYVSSSIASDISPIEKDGELLLQNEHLNTLDIVGLPLRSGDQEWLLSLVKILCNYLLVPWNTEDIENVQTDGRALIVTFREQYKKDQVHIAMRGKSLRSDQLLKLWPQETSTPIRTYQRVTISYRHLIVIAQTYIINNELSSYRITNRGLGIMFTRHDNKFVYNQSEHELHEQISQYKFTKKASN